MTDIPDSRRASEHVNRLRQEAFAKEAEALRQDVVKYFREQAQTDLNSLQAGLKEELRKAVKEAVTDPRVKEIIGKELTEQLVGSVASSVAQKIGERLTKDVQAEVKQAEGRILEAVRKDLLGSWTKEANRTLKDGFKSALEEVSQERFTETEIKASWRSRLSKLIMGKNDEPKEVEKQEKRVLPVTEVPRTATVASPSQRSGVEGGAGGATPPVMSPEIERERIRMLWRRRGGIAALIFLISMSIIWLRFSADPRGSGTATPTPEVEVAPSTEPEELTISDRQLLQSWMSIVESAVSEMDPELLLQLKKYNFTQQYMCWFNNNAQKNLERLARGSASASGVKTDLDTTFASCFAREPELGESGLPVFSAQATVRVLLSRKLADWDAFCGGVREREGVPSLVTKLYADGNPGQNTYSAMGVFLSCTGRNDELSIGPDSKAPEYLYITYLALRELQIR